MRFAQIAGAIRARFSTEWPQLRPSAPVAYDNTAFDPTRDALDAGGRNLASWVRLTIIPGDGFQASLGTPRVWRATGIVVVQVFSPLGEGDGSAYSLADDVAAIFRGVTVQGVVFRAPSLTHIGPDGAWYQINVATPFQVNDTA